MIRRPTRSSDLQATQYTEHRAEVVTLLRSRFGSALNDSDREDLYHEAWAGAIEFERKGRDTPDLCGLLKTIAWRRGRDKLRNRSADPTDPLEGALALALDRGPTPDEHAEVQEDVELCRQIIDSLSERQRRLLKLRYEWQFSPSETQQALGLSRKAYEKQLTRALKRVTAAVAEVEDGSWRAQQLELLLSCEAGTATGDERERARRLVNSDPACRAMLRRIRSVAALTPLPVLFGRGLQSAPFRLGCWLGRRGVRMAQVARASHPVVLTRAVAAAPTATAIKVVIVSVTGIAAAGGAVAQLTHNGAPAPPRMAPAPPAPIAAPFEAGRLGPALRAGRHPSVTHPRGPAPARKPAVVTSRASGTPRLTTPGPVRAAAPERHGQGVVHPPSVAPQAARPSSRSRATARSRGDGLSEFGP